MKKGLILFLILSILSSMAGCSLFTPKTKVSEVNLYYPTSEGTVGSEKRTVEAATGADALLTKTITELLKGPADKSLMSTIPEGTYLMDASVKDKVAVLNLSQEFSGFPGVMAEAFALISLVNTSADLPGIEKVLIKVSGGDLISPKGEPYGPLPKYDIESFNREMSAQVITLYFPDDNAMFVVPEERKVYTEGPLEETVMEELLKGPENPDLFPANIPKGAKLLSVEVKDGTAYVDFSKELKTNHSGGSTGEAMTIYPIVSSLTALPNIDKVQFLIEGKKEEILAGHVTFDEPFKRNEDMIKK